MLRTFLTNAAKNDAIVKQSSTRMNFYTITRKFSNIYPEYTEYFGKPLRLMKSAYGMILSSKNLFLELQGYLTTQKGRFIRSDVDNALFIRKEADGRYTKMLVYIDDKAFILIPKTIKT